VIQNYNLYDEAGRIALQSEGVEVFYRASSAPKEIAGFVDISIGG